MAAEYAFAGYPGYGIPPTSMPVDSSSKDAMAQPYMDSYSHPGAVQPNASFQNSTDYNLAKFAANPSFNANFAGNSHVPTHSSSQPFNATNPSLGMDSYQTSESYVEDPSQGAYAMPESEYDSQYNSYGYYNYDQSYMRPPMPHSQPQRFNAAPRQPYSQRPYGYNKPQPFGNGRAPMAPRANVRGGFGERLGDPRTGNRQSTEDPNGIRNDTVFVSGLSQPLDHENLKGEFGKIGAIKVNKKSEMPMIWIFKEGGQQTGSALITYESVESAAAAVNYFTVNTLNGTQITVRLAKNDERPKLNSTNNFNNASGQRPPPNDYSSQRDPFKAYQRGRGGGPMKPRGRGGMGPPRVRGQGSQGETNQREGDWSCSNCSNNNFAWRESCNRCQTPKQGGPGGGAPPPSNRGFRGGRGGGSRFTPY